jgi:hypothetical protein
MTIKLNSRVLNQIEPISRVPPNDSPPNCSIREVLEDDDDDQTDTIPLFSGANFYQHSSDDDECDEQDELQSMDEKNEQINAPTILSNDSLNHTLNSLPFNQSTSNLEEISTSRVKMSKRYYTYELPVEEYTSISSFIKEYITKNSIQSDHRWTQPRRLHLMEAAKNWEPPIIDTENTLIEKIKRFIRQSRITTNTPSKDSFSPSPDCTSTGLTELMCSSMNDDICC